MEREIRTYPAEIRIDKSGEQPVIRGHAAVYNRMSENLGGFYEVIMPGFFDSMMGDDVRALINHDGNRVLGRTKANTLKIRTDEEGLHNIIYPPDTSYARDLMESMERGDIDQQSFQFSVPADGSGERWYQDDEGRTIRELIKGKRLYDVTIATFPAYPDATAIAKRTLDAYASFKAENREDEDNVSDPEDNSAQGSADIARRKLEIEKAI